MNKYTEWNKSYGAKASYNPTGGFRTVNSCSNIHLGQSTDLKPDNRPPLVPRFWIG